MTATYDFAIVGMVGWTVLHYFITQTREASGFLPASLQNRVVHPERLEKLKIIGHKCTW